MVDADKLQREKIPRMNKLINNAEKRHNIKNRESYGEDDELGDIASSMSGRVDKIERVKKIEDTYKRLHKTLTYDVKNIFNEGLDAWVRFQNYSLLQLQAWTKGEGNFAVDEQNTPDQQIPLREKISEVISDPHIYTIDDDLSELLLRTKAKVYARPLPFDYFFINKTFKLINNKIIILGITITNDDRLYFKGDGSKVEKDNRFQVIVVGIDSRDKSFFFYFITVDKNGYMDNGEIIDENPLKGEIMFKKGEIENKIVPYVCNFLDFLNHPDLEVIEYQKATPQQQQNRREKGRTKLPNKMTVSCTGRILRHIYKQKTKYAGSSHNRKKLDYSFWVSGHFMHFIDEVRYKRLYLLGEEQLKKGGYQRSHQGIIMRWVFPHLRGTGDRLIKEYNLTVK